MIKADKLSPILFTSSLDTFSFQIDGDSATVTITCAGEEVLRETYYPTSGIITIYDLGTLIADFVRPTVRATFSITITEHRGETDLSAWVSEDIVAYYSTADIDMDAMVFLNQFFLTLLEGKKLTKLGRREYLHASGDDVEKAEVTAHFFDGGKLVSVEAPEDCTILTSVNGITTMDVSPGHYEDLHSGNLFAYTVRMGKRIQEYQIDFNSGTSEPAILFSNAFGCQEIFYCTGKQEVAKEFERKSAVINNRKVNYSIKGTRTFKADTGMLPPGMVDFIDDLLGSDELYLFRNGMKDREIVVTDSKMEYSNEDDGTFEFTLSYQYSQKIQNIIYKDGNAAGKIFDSPFGKMFN